MQRTQAAWGKGLNLPPLSKFLEEAAQAHKLASCELAARAAAGPSFRQEGRPPCSGGASCPLPTPPPPPPGLPPVEAKAGALSSFRGRRLWLREGRE